MHWLTTSDLLRGQTLQMVTFAALVLAHAQRSLYWAVIPETSMSSPSISQSFPPPTRMMWERGWSAGRSSRLLVGPWWHPQVYRCTGWLQVFLSAVSLMVLIAWRLRLLMPWRNSTISEANFRFHSSAWAMARSCWSFREVIEEVRPWTISTRQAMSLVRVVTWQGSWRQEIILDSQYLK